MLRLFEHEVSSQGALNESINIKSSNQLQVMRGKLAMVSYVYLSLIGSIFCLEIHQIFPISLVSIPQLKKKPVGKQVLRLGHENQETWKIKRRYMHMIVSLFTVVAVLGQVAKRL